jgi:uncharacterized OsmC-like protein
MVLRRIHVAYALRVEAPETLDVRRRASIQRALEHHADDCPLARTLAGRVEITSELELVAPEVPA